MTSQDNPLRLPLHGNRAHPEVMDLLTELLARSLQVRITVSGISMQPVLADNDIVTLHKIAAADLRRGDLILYPGASRQLTLHRLIRRFKDHQGVHWLQTCGDALRGADRPVRASDILATVRCIEKHQAADADRIIDFQLTRHRLHNRLRGWVLYCRVATRYVAARIRPGFISVNKKGQAP